MKTHCKDRSEGRNIDPRSLGRFTVEEGVKALQIIANATPTVEKEIKKLGITTDTLSPAFLKGDVDDHILVETALKKIKGSKNIKARLMGILVNQGIVNTYEIPDMETLLKWPGVAEKTAKNLLKLKKMR